MIASACSSLPPARSGAALAGARAHSVRYAPDFGLQGRVARGCDFGHVRLARSLRGLSDAFEKPALPRVPAPRPRRPQNKEAVPGRLYFARQPEQTPSAERPENKEAYSPTMFYEERGRQPRTIYRCTHRYSGVAAFARAAQQTEGWGLLYCAASTFIGAARPCTPANRKQGLLQGFSLSDAGSIPRIVTRVR